MTVQDQIAGKFLVICEPCRVKAYVEFGEGYIHANGGDLGYLIFCCTLCGQNLEIDDDH